MKSPFCLRYPKNLHYKIFQRRGQCLTALGKHAEAEDALKASAVLIGRTSRTVTNGIFYVKWVLLSNFNFKSCIVKRYRVSLY